MKPGLLPLAVATALLVAAGVAAVLVFGTAEGDGGGGGDTSTLEGYFQVLNTAQTEISSGYTDISSQYPEVFIDKQQTLDYLEASAAAWGDAVTTLENIDPPDEASSAHSGLIQATGEVGSAFDALLATVTDVEDTEEALQTAIQEADTTAFDAYGEACGELQTLADDNAVMDETGQPIALVC
jgi:hypothetical protein